MSLAGIDRVKGIIHIQQLFNETGSTITSGTVLTGQIVLVKVTANSHTAVHSIPMTSTYTGASWNHNQDSQSSYRHVFSFDTTLSTPILAGETWGVSVQITNNYKKYQKIIQCSLMGRMV
jgi:hypothetical protein